MSVSAGDVRVGERLRAARRSRGLTISEVAERAGVTAGFISQLERDLTSASLSSLYRICTALEIDLEALVSAPGHPAKRSTTKRRAAG